MVDSSTENANEDKQPKDETTDEEFHDAATVITGSGPSLNGNEKTEIHILVEITYRGASEALTTPSKHLQILNALGGAFDKAELDMYDKKGRKVNRASVQQWRDITTHEDHFQIQQANNRHYVIFRALTTKKFGDLKRAPKVWETLNRTGSYMKRHHWSIDQWDIITLGFLIEIDPSRHLSDEVRQYVIDLSKREGCFKENGCNFKLIPERFKFRNKGEPFTTYAYAVQCPRADAKAVDALMKSTFRDEGQSYVKLKLKKTFPASYSNAMTLQNRYLSHVRTITLVGITRSTMKIVKHTLLMQDAVTYVAATNKTDTTGRWDVITMDVCQEKLHAWLEANLDSLLAECPPESTHDRPATFPAPGIQSRNARATDEDSSQGDVSYLSSSAGSYDSVVQNYNDQDHYHEEPGQGIIKGQTWAQAVARNPQSASTSSSQPTESNISELTTPTAAQHNKRYDAMEKRLNEELMEMRKDMARMLDMMQARDNKSAEEDAERKARAQDIPEPHYPPRYPPTTGMQGYQNTGYNYHPQYQGYPAGLPPSQPYYMSPHRHQPPGPQDPNLVHNGDQQDRRQQYSQAIVSVTRDLNKRSHQSPSFSASEDRSKRQHQRETPVRDKPMAEAAQPPDPTGQSRMMTHNPYNRRPGTPTPVSPPSHVVRGLYPLEWNKGRQEEQQHPEPFDYGSQQQHGTEQERPIRHPAEDARHFGV
jgi:hypothetical protein